VSQQYFVTISAPGVCQPPSAACEPRQPFAHSREWPSSEPRSSYSHHSWQSLSRRLECLCVASSSGARSRLGTSHPTVRRYRPTRLLEARRLRRRRCRCSRGAIKAPVWRPAKGWPVHSLEPAWRWLHLSAAQRYPALAPGLSTDSPRPHRSCASCRRGPALLLADNPHVV